MSPAPSPFPAAWLDSVDGPEIERLLTRKGIVAGQEIAVYGQGPDDARAFVAGLDARGIHGARIHDEGFGAWAADPDLPIDRLARHDRLVHIEVARAGPRRWTAGGGAGRQVPAVPRQLRGSRGIRGGPRPGRAVPRHELAREPGRLESPVAGGARGRGPGARDHERHDGRAVWPGHGR